MEIKKRLERLERQSKASGAFDWDDVRECEHLSLKLRRDYVFPPVPNLEYRQVLRVHCDQCGFDGYFWNFSEKATKSDCERLADAEFLRLTDLKRCREIFPKVVSEMRAAGLVDFVPFPVPQELLDEFPGIRVTLSNSGIYAN